MIRVLLKGAVGPTVISVLIVAALCTFALSEADGLGALLGGILAGAEFLALVYLVGKLLDPTLPPKSKLRLGLLMAAKLALVALAFLWLVSAIRVGGLGLSLGIAAAIGGFTVGVSSASRSEEGQRAQREEEERIAAQEKRDAEGDID